MTTRDFLRETIGLIALMIFLGGLFIFVAVHPRGRGEHSRQY